MKHQMKPAPVQSIADTQRGIIENFQRFDDWISRYEYLIELGRKLPTFPDAQRIEANRLHGCQSYVWLLGNHYQGRLFFQATSDSTIVAGLIALLLKVYSGRTPEDILASPPSFINEIGLAQHLSANRANGLSHMMARIQTLAATVSDQNREADS